MLIWVEPELQDLHWYSGSAYRLVHSLTYLEAFHGSFLSLRFTSLRCHSLEFIATSGRMTEKLFGRKWLWPNRGTIAALAWKG
jgi:hypothetical protein